MQGTFGAARQGEVFDVFGDVLKVGGGRAVASIGADVGCPSFGVITCVQPRHHHDCQQRLRLCFAASGVLGVQDLLVDATGAVPFLEVGVVPDFMHRVAAHAVGKFGACCGPPVGQGFLGVLVLAEMV